MLKGVKVKLFELVTGKKLEDYLREECAPRNMSFPNVAILLNNEIARGKSSTNKIVLELMKTQRITKGNVQSWYLRAGLVNKYVRPKNPRKKKGKR